MRSGVTILILLLLLAACKKREQSTVIAEREMNDFRMYVHSMEGKGADTSTLYFMFVIKAINGQKMPSGSDSRFNYGVDSLFYMVNGKDTLPALDAMRMANGNIDGIQYMLVFDRPATADTLRRIVFRDWLFTSHVISFPFKQQ
ncbi:hypothetical protein [Chitinophaga sp.]|uniref:hypothetical protein n=1 Tax=Chitinophaga sp. TaxID=1869181 RepID=UPI0031DD8490